ncbi:MAG: glycosyltransferase [Synergistaceae bacterium]|nr:glycosyltransferase [Synergistaceae bacterium]
MTATRNKISVVLATFNGIKFIKEQLDSIRTQTQIPDEVIISDDCSNDGTYEFCRKYIDEHKLNGWTVHRNPENLGVRKNFRNAMMKCTGDYIFTCDQDDIWIPDKISVMVQAMNEHPEILLLASNYIPFRNGETINAHVKNLSRDDGEIIPLRLKDYWLGNLRPGCTFCFRRKILERFSVMDIEERHHDSMLWKYAMLSDGLMITPENQEAMKRKLNFIERRKQILAKRNPFTISLFVLLNIKYYPTLRNALSDIYASIKRRE